MSAPRLLNSGARYWLPKSKSKLAPANLLRQYLRFGTSLNVLSLRNMRTWLEEARKGNPRFELGMNIGHGINEGPGPEGDERTALWQWPQSLGYAGEQQPLWLHEGALNITFPEYNAWDTWTRKLMQLFRATQKLGGHFLAPEEC